ncbi:MAG: hypothetical protein RRY34_07560, partial [Victivallaceae bacterium]
MVTTYTYDDFKRLSTQTRDGITTLFSYDAGGNRVATTVKGRNNGEITTLQRYSLGNLVESEDALGNVTAYGESYATDATSGVVTYTQSVTNPDNSTQQGISVNGLNSSSSGTAQHTQSYTYGPNWQKANEQNITVYRDLLGRSFKTEYADGTSSMNYYNNKKQLIRSVSPGGVVTLYTYDNAGRQIKQVVDVDRNMIPSPQDLTTSTEYSFGTYEGKSVIVSTATRSQMGNSTVISTSRRSVDGFDSWSTDAAGLTTHSKFERLGGGRTRQTVTAPTGIKQITETLNGRTDFVQVYDSANSLNSVTSYTYDEFNRVGAVSERNGANELLNEVSYSYNVNGEVLTQSVNGQITSFEYDVMGRQTKVTAPGGVVTNYQYYPTGELKRVDGSEYPVEFSYDELGNKKTMKTYKDATTPQVTTWNYNNRNFLISKVYADGTGPSYTYNADGQMVTRSWVRQINGTPLTTTYSYDNAGRMTGYAYNDGVTP